MISLQQDRTERQARARNEHYGLRTTGYRLVLPLVFAILAGSAYAEQAVLAVGSGEGDVGSLVSIPVTLTTNGTQPSTINFWIEFDPNTLAFDHVEAGGAALAADKEVDANISEPGVVRFVIYRKANPIGDGVLLEATFEIIGGESGETLLLNGSTASIADPDAEPIEQQITGGQIDVACMGRPQDVAASQGQPDGVLVTWGETAGATGYQVYRGDTADAGSAQPISPWLDASAVSYLDTSAASIMGCGCSGLSPFGAPVYYYWVRAQGAPGCESLLAGPVSGSADPAKAVLTEAGATMGGVFGGAAFRGAEGDILLALLLVSAAFLGSARIRNYELRIKN